jgi:hypothetical protein
MEWRTDAEETANCRLKNPEIWSIEAREFAEALAHNSVDSLLQVSQCPTRLSLVDSTTASFSA